MPTYTLYQIDSFTKELFKGNPAGVVLNADGLTETQMQLLARELNNSETAFLFSPDSGDCDGVVRYFTPTTEVPLCGHATIAAMYAKAVTEHLETAVFKMKTGAGVLPFAITKIANDYLIVMTQGQINFEPAFEGELKERILKNLGLTGSDLNESCPVQIVSTGHSKVLIGINSRRRLNELAPDFAGLAALSRIINCNGYYVFTFDSDSSGILTYGRMFAPAVGINEDPVTGNANGPLGAYLIQHGLVDTSRAEFSFKARQGQAINRLGEMEVMVQIAGRRPVLVQIAGTAVIVFKTAITI